MNDLLKTLGWTQADLVRQLGCNPKTVQRWCQGDNHKMAYRAVMSYLECTIRSEGNERA